MVQCSRNWLISPNIIIMLLAWVTMLSIDHWFIHMFLIYDWLIHMKLIVDWFIYYTTDGWLVYLLHFLWMIGLFITLLIDNWFSGFGEGRRAASFHVTDKKKKITLLEQNCRILLHLFICGNFEHNFIFICFKNNQGLFSYFRLDHESVV